MDVILKTFIHNSLDMAEQIAADLDKDILYYCRYAIRNLEHAWEDNFIAVPILLKEGGKNGIMHPTAEDLACVLCKVFTCGKALQNFRARGNLRTLAVPTKGMLLQEIVQQLEYIRKGCNFLVDYMNKDNLPCYSFPRELPAEWAHVTGAPVQEPKPATLKRVARPKQPLAAGEEEEEEQADQTKRVKVFTPLT
jgi:hypothetical protein